MAGMTEQAISPSKRSAWIEAARPRTLALGLGQHRHGDLLGGRLTAAFAGLVALFCALTTIFLQILSNFANDYGDTRSRP